MFDTIAACITHVLFIATQIPKRPRDEIIQETEGEMIGCHLQETDDKLAARTRENRVSERVGQANDVAVRSIFRKLKDSSCNWIKLLEGRADLSLSLSLSLSLCPSLFPS